MASHNPSEATISLAPLLGRAMRRTSGSGNTTSPACVDASQVDKREGVGWCNLEVLGVGGMRFQVKQEGGEGVYMHFHIGKRGGRGWGGGHQR